MCAARVSTKSGQMQYEVEQKYRVSDLGVIRSTLHAKGAEFREPKRQVDRYFAHPARDFGVTDEAFRLRRDGAENRITYKGPKLDGKTKTRREIEIPLLAGDDYLDQFTRLLDSLGFRVVAEVTKQRTPGSVSWQGRTVELALDEVEGVGEFLELELISTEAELAVSRSTVSALSADLGLVDSIRTSYLEMLLAVRGQSER